MTRGKKEWLRLQLKVKIEEIGIENYLHENGRTGKDAAKKQKKTHGSDY